MESSWRAGDPWSSVAVVLMRRGRDKHRWKKALWRWDRDKKDVATSQGTSRIPGKHRKAGEKHGRASLSAPLTGTNIIPFFFFSKQKFSHIYYWTTRTLVRKHQESNIPFLPWAVQTAVSSHFCDSVTVQVTLPWHKWVPTGKWGSLEAQLGSSPVSFLGVIPDFITSFHSNPLGNGTILLLFLVRNCLIFKFLWKDMGRSKFNRIEENGEEKRAFFLYFKYLVLRLMLAKLVLND